MFFRGLDLCTLEGGSSVVPRGLLPPAVVHLPLCDPDIKRVKRIQEQFRRGNARSHYFDCRAARGDGGWLGRPVDEGTPQGDPPIVSNLLLDDLDQKLAEVVTASAVERTTATSMLAATAPTNVSWLA